MSFLSIDVDTERRMRRTEPADTIKAWDDWLRDSGILALGAVRIDFDADDSALVTHEVRDAGGDPHLTPDRSVKRTTTRVPLPCLPPIDPKWLTPPAPPTWEP